MTVPLSVPTILTAEQTADHLPFDALCAAIADAAHEYTAGRIVSPERQVLPLPKEGVLLSMPATAQDIAIHKLVNVCPANVVLGLPTIHGVVTVYDGPTGAPLVILDGPTVTGRRTAAVSMLAIRTLARQEPAHVALIGCGKQSSYHAEALAALHPGIRVDCHARNLDSARAFCLEHDSLDLDLRPITGAVDPAADVVITLTTSRQPVYDEVARPDRLLIGVGAFKPDMAEYGPTSIHASEVFLDDPAGARHEAGDLIQAGFEWTKGHSLVDALERRVPSNQPLLFKSVGCAAWDLAAGRCALAVLRRSHAP